MRELGCIEMIEKQIYGEGETVNKEGFSTNKDLRVQNTGT